MRFLSRSEVPVALQIAGKSVAQRRYALALSWDRSTGGRRVAAAALRSRPCAAVKARSFIVPISLERVGDQAIVRDSTRR